jgi:excisionase family DNA binding protein
VVGSLTASGTVARVDKPRRGHGPPSQLVKTPARLARDRKRRAREDEANAARNGPVTTRRVDDASPPTSTEASVEPELREDVEEAVPHRFLKLDDVAAELAISWSQTYALVRSGELAAIKIGGRGQWRVEHSALEEYIARCYEETRAFVATHPASEDESPMLDG